MKDGTLVISRVITVVRFDNSGSNFFIEKTKKQLVNYLACIYLAAVTQTPLLIVLSFPRSRNDSVKQAISGLLAYPAGDNALRLKTVIKVSQLHSEVYFSANCLIFGQSFSLGHFPPIYCSPEGVYLKIHYTLLSRSLFVKPFLLRKFAGRPEGHAVSG